MLESAPPGNAVIAAPASPPRLRVGPPRDWAAGFPGVGPTICRFSSLAAPGATSIAPGASNVPVSGAAAELYDAAGHSPRPLYWQVRRLVASPKELILRHATRRGGPMAHVRAGARLADDLPGDAALRQHRFFRHPRWYGDGGGSPR